MRLKLVVTIFFFFTILMIDGAFAECNNTVCGECSGYCGTQTCTYSGTLNYPTDSNCPVTGECAVYNCYDQGVSCQDPSDPNNFYPVSGVCCDQTQCTSCENTGGSNCIYETADVLCNCSPTPTPTPNPSPTEGAGTPTPTGTSTPTPTPTTSLIQGSIHDDLSAALSGAYCTQSTTSPINDLSGITLRASATGQTTQDATFSLTNPSNYSIANVLTGTGYNVTLNLTNQVGTNYVCSCPAPISVTDPYICRYSGVFPPLAGVNFYLKEYSLSNDSWFQVFGGNLFASNLVASTVPESFCAGDAACEPALNLPMSSSNPLSSGFSVVATSDPSRVRTSDVSEAYHSYLHLATRPSNRNAYALNTDLAPLSYDYFYRLAETSAIEIGNGEDLEPLLSDFTSAPWWQTGEVNYVKINGNVSIDESQGFFLSSGQQLVIFVDGRLTFDDSNPNDSNRKITSVADGGFLAFITSGDIWITPHVGYELDPSIPTVPAVTLANSNLEGVFIADDSLIMQSKTAIGEVPPDRKFIGAGTFVGWGDVALNRTFDDGGFGPILNNNQAIENFIYRSDLLVNWPVKLKASTSNWREVDPQLIGQ